MQATVRQGLTMRTACKAESVTACTHAGACSIGPKWGTWQLPAHLPKCDHYINRAKKSPSGIHSHLVLLVLQQLQMLLSFTGKLPRDTRVAKPTTKSRPAKRKRHLQGTKRETAQTGHTLHQCWCACTMP
jgi:hypothetical protein